MPTYRKLHARILESGDIADMPDDFHRLVWTWLPLILSSDGTTIYDARYIRSRMFPLRDDIHSERIAEVLAWFEQRRMILPYDGDGRRYLYVPTFAKYQGDTSREADSTFPKPPADIDTTHEDYMQSACNPHATVAKESCSDTDTDADAYANADTNTATAPVSRKVPAERVVDHETTPEPELLRELHQAFQRGTGQAVTEALPTGNAKTALRQMLDDKQTPGDIEACARYLKLGWWSDKMLTVPKLAEGLGQWIAQGRPVKPNGNGHGHSPPKTHLSDTLEYINQQIAEGERREAEHGTT